MTAVTFTIRRATADDHAEIVGVIDQWWGGRRMAALVPSLFLEHFASSSFVAHDEQGLAGFLIGFLSQDEPGDAYVHFLGVRPDTRGSGLGRMLHDRFAHTVAAFGVTTVRAVTSTENRDSVDFHSRIGFVIDGIDEPLPIDGVDDAAGHVLMSREIVEAQADFVVRRDPRPDELPWPPSTGWPIDPSLVLENDTVRLTVSTEAEAAALFEVLDDDAVWAHVAGRPRDVEGMAKVIRFKLTEPTWCPFTIRLKREVGGVPEGTIVGTTSYLEVFPNEARGEIGSTLYTPALWATTVNPACKRLLLSHAFDEMGWGRVQLKTDIRNHRSQRAIARLGARYEGVLRRYQRRGDGSMRDSVLFSVIVEQWPAVRDRLDARLAAAPRA